MKSTPFESMHKALGAQMASFAGYNMPIRYGSIQEEHEAVRKRVGLFDVSHMGEFLVKGPHAANLVQHISSNDVAKLTPGQAQYSCMPNDNGGIVDDLLIYKISDREFMLVVNASNIEKDWDWISEHNHVGAEMENISDEMALLAVQGPYAVHTLQPLTEQDLSAIKYYHFIQGTLAGIDNVIISATGYTGSGGFELYFHPDHAKRIWKAIMESGASHGIQPAGLGARDTLRLEMGFCLYGNDINDTTSPIEAGLGWITKLVEGNDFVGRDSIEQLKINGIDKKLVGLEMVDRGIPRQHYRIQNSTGEDIGEVTSGTMAPTLGRAIGMGYVGKEYVAVDTEIYVVVRDKPIKAKVVKLPFYKMD